MRNALTRLVRFLRSRRLAVALIAFLAVYGVIGTVVPRGGSDDIAVRMWAARHPVAEAIAAPLGLHGAYASPLFIALAALIAASTAACAVERTRRARIVMRSALRLTEASQERLRECPQFVFRVASDLSPQQVAASVAEGLTKIGLKARVESTSVDARAGVVGLLGSPLFHWSIVALMLVVAAGQATRSEGFMALPLGERVADQHANYLQVTDGPLFGERHTGIEFEATKIDRAYVSGGVAYGTVPAVTAYLDTVPIASGNVHANKPLRVGSLMLHMADYGPTATLSLESPGGAEVSREIFTVDRSDATSSGTKPQVFTVPGPPGAEGVSARIQIVVQRTSDSSAAVISRALIETATVGSDDFGPAVIVTEGAAIDLPGGSRLRLANVSDWVRVSIANDWSVPYIYLLLFVAILGLGLAVLIPTRRVSVLLVEREGDHAVHVALWHARSDTLFKRQVLEAVRAATGDMEDE